MVANVFVGDSSPPPLAPILSQAPWHVFTKNLLPSLIVPAAAVKLPGEYLFLYLDSGCRVFCVGLVITPIFQRAYGRDVNPNSQKVRRSHRIRSHRHSCTGAESRMTAHTAPPPTPRSLGRNYFT